MAGQARASVAHDPSWQTTLTSRLQVAAVVVFWQVLQLATHEPSTQTSGDAAGHTEGRRSTRPAHWSTEATQAPEGHMTGAPDGQMAVLETMLAAAALHMEPVTTHWLVTYKWSNRVVTLTYLAHGAGDDALAVLAHHRGRVVAQHRSWAALRCVCALPVGAAPGLGHGAAIAQRGARRGGGRTAAVEALCRAEHHA